MLKLARSEYKNLIIAPIICVLYGLIQFFIDLGAALKAGTIDVFRGRTTMLFNEVDEAMLLISVLVVTAILLQRTWKKDDIFRLTDVPEWKLLLTRALMLFGLTAAVTFIFMSESAIVGNILVNKFGFDGAESTAIMPFVTTLKPFASWLLPLATGLFSVVLYATGLAATPVVRLKEWGRLSRGIATVTVVAALLTCYLAVANITTNFCDFANFNKTVTLFSVDVEGRYVNEATATLLPTSVLRFFDNQSAWHATLITMVNIFSIGELLFTLMYLGFCYICFTLYNRRTADDAVARERYKKSQAAKYAFTACCLLGTVIFCAVTTRTPDVFKQYDRPRKTVEITGQTGDVVSVADYMGEYANMKGCKTVIDYYCYSVVGETPEGRPIKKFHYDAAEVDEKQGTLKLLQEGEYVISVGVRQRYTGDDAYIVGIKITVGASAENSGA